MIVRSCSHPQGWRDLGRKYLHQRVCVQSRLLAQQLSEWGPQGKCPDSSCLSCLWLCCAICVMFSRLWFITCYPHHQASLVAQKVKNLPAMQGTWVPSLGQEYPLEKEVATDSNILTWEIPEKQRRLAGYGPCSHKELDTTKWLSTYTHQQNSSMFSNIWNHIPHTVCTRKLIQGAWPTVTASPTSIQ